MKKAGIPAGFTSFRILASKKNTTSEELKSINSFSDIVTCRSGIILLLDLDDCCSITVSLS